MHDPGLRLAKVTAVYPDGHSVDVKFYDDGSPASNVQVLSGTASTKSGFHDLPAPGTAPGGDQWSMQDSGTDMIAVVGFIRGMPVVLGFLYPQVNQMLFADKNRMVYRHASGVYFTITGSGDTELCHPSGAFVRIGASGDHEDLSGKDLDGGWNIPVTSPGNIRVEQAGGVAKLNIDPVGNIDLEHDGNLTTTTVGNLSATVSGTTTVTSTGAMTLAAPTVTINAPLITFNGAVVQGKGTNGGNCQMQGPLLVVDYIKSDTDVFSTTVSGKTHRHIDTQPGSGNSGTPV